MPEPLANVLVMVFSLGNGQYGTMDTLRAYATAADCIHATTIENSNAHRRQLPVQACLSRQYR